MDAKTRIEASKANLRKAEQARTVAETQLTTAKAQEEEVIKQMAAEGVTPENINDEIARLEQQINADLDKIEQLIPRV